MKYNYHCDQRMYDNSNEPLDLPMHYYYQGIDKVEISPECGFYMHKNKIAYIERQAEIISGEFSWKILVREVLLEVYGANLKNFCALGKRGSLRPPINHQLFVGLYEWASRKAQEYKEFISRKEYVDLINKTAANKRSRSEKKIQQKNKND
ncbi:uncharacterized protein LOC127286417 [Leptopilina boulardi]|uniref:uncharacterized protein LOC127286417 n=1 Tax=Leptopilina boulardi TaxID=63433 RepID=UPI0021F544FF|nr:uncharacterized protein LOC127286417 [Leptopilina boulardi]